MVQDYTGPSISSIVATVTSLDVTNSPQILTISFRATDTSGVNLNDLGRQGFEMGNNGYNFDNPYVLISGTNKDGTYAASTTLSSSTHPPGNLRLYNKAIKDINDFYSNSFRPDPYIFTIINNSGADFSGPTISSIVVTVTSLDVTNSPQILTISFRATDTSGVNLNDLGRQGFEMGNNGYNFDNPYVLISGTNKDGTYAASTTLSSSTHPPGNLRLYNKSIKDINDFFSNSFRPDPYIFTIINNSGADFSGPSISNVKVNPTTINNFGGVLTISFRATDTSGVNLNDLGRQGFEMGNNGYNFDNPYVLISGTNKDGTYAASTTLSSSTHPPGNLRLYNKSIKDINDFFSNSFRPDPYNLTVINYDCSSITPSNGLDVSQTVTMQDIQMVQRYQCFLTMLGKLELLHWIFYHYLNKFLMIQQDFTK